MKKCISPLVIFCSLLLLLRPAFSQCQGTWGINTSSFKDFGDCKLIEPGPLVWKTTGTDDKYHIYIRQFPYPGYSEKRWEETKLLTGTHDATGSYDELDVGQNYYVTFNCQGSILNPTCNKGRFEWHFLECGCPAGSTIGTPCDKANAKDVQCDAPPPPSPSKLYIFKYEVKDFEFEPLPDIITEKQSWLKSNGIIENCADGATADHKLKLSHEIENSQSMTVSKSFTSSKTDGWAAGVSVTAKAEANVIFAKLSAETTASFDYSRSSGDSETEETSTTMETSSKIKLEQAMTVSVEPNTCIEYSLSSNVSSEPLEVPYTANSYLTIFHNDEKQEQVRDLATLQLIQEDVFIEDSTIEYDSTIVNGRIVYPIDGVFSGLYATKAKTETSNCDKCGSIAITSPPANPPRQNDPSADSPSPQPNAIEHPSSAAAMLGLSDIAVGIMLTLTFALN